MALFLVQHGKNLPKEADPEKGLSPEGIADVRRIAQVAGGYGVRVSKILHSGKKRAFQTAEIFAEALSPAEGMAGTAGLKPTDDPEAFAEKFRPEDNVMLVGHLPFMEKMAGFLITGDPGLPVFQFQNGGIVCLDTYPGTEDWVIRWALMPRIG
ncbi:phosphohistidine phosphatase SixA [Desulfonema ishimotonii]|uniref:Phosphohistidine phosphatase SixA n=1 Tax=Desulfonema ishimotonii TaxID=45657 RepID=A0A401FVY4_9BACT|nr:phosphohistidine phosphatase SixA [Desulfonema ishimotonii]GBC61125.1 phosphohistidine phosphatase SixA [Desulfonema ishimotonii]